MKLCTCHTDGCANEGVGFLWDYDTDAARAAADGVTLGPPWCGGCSTEITDIRDQGGESTGEGGFTELSGTEDG